MHSIITTAQHEDGSIAYRAQEQRDPSGQTILTLTGEFDYDANAVLDGIVERLSGGVARDVVVDLSGVEFFNGHGLAAMLHLERATQLRGFRLVLRCQAGTVCRLLGLIGLAGSIHIVGPAPQVRSPALRLVAGHRREPNDRLPRRRHRPAGQVGRRWHHGEN